MTNMINIFYTTCGNIEDARKLTNIIVSEKEIICVNIIKNVESFYKEDGKIISSKEIILIVKTSLKKKCFEKLLKNHHPYDIPFITRLKNDSVNNAYLEWAKKI